MMSGRFSNRNRIGYDFEDELDEMIRDRLAPEDERDLLKPGFALDYSSIERFLVRIPPREADLIRLYYKERMKQEQIARLFRITQAAVSYRLHRGIKRIQFLLTIPELELEPFFLELGPKFSEQDLEILWRMYETTCQSEIAKQMGLTQGRVRHRFFRALDKIVDLIKEDARERVIQIRALRSAGASLDTIAAAEGALGDDIAGSKYGKYRTVFTAISDRHFNILHEVSLPQFRDRGDAQILSLAE